MFESFQANDEGARWIVVQQLGKRRFYLQNIAAFTPITFILVGKLTKRFLPAMDRLILIPIVLTVALLLTYSVTLLLWRRGLRLTQQST
jgi:hypothetical protein